MGCLVGLPVYMQKRLIGRMPKNYSNESVQLADITGAHNRLIVIHNQKERRLHSCSFLFICKIYIFTLNSLILFY